MTIAYKCKIQQREYQRRHYEANKVAYIERSRESKRQARLRIRQFIADYLADKCCSDCGEADPIVLDFDHRSDKLFNIGDAQGLGYTNDRLMSEMIKCDIRCANCHRRKTYAEQR